MSGHEAIERERRLIGDNDGDEASGKGALPLPEAFTAVLQHLHDKGPATATALTRIIKDKVAYKEKRVLAVYGNWDDFATDILAQLHHKELAAVTSDVRWELGEMVTPGVLYPVAGGINVVVYDQKEREKRNQMAKLAMDAASLQAQFRDAGLLSEGREQGFALILDGLQVKRAARAKDESRLHNGLSAFYRDKYVAAHGWHRLDDVLQAWREAYPGKDSVARDPVSVLRKTALGMHKEGLLERKEYSEVRWSPSKRGGVAARGAEYRWTGGEVPPPPAGLRYRRRADQHGNRVIPSGTPQRHPEEPGREFQCEGCEQWKPLTDKNWQQAPSHEKEWYWSLKYCRSCKHS